MNDMAIREIGAEELKRLDAAVAVVDVREPAEFACKRLAGSRNVPLSQVETADWPKDRPILLVCRSGRRSAEAARRLSARGFADLTNLAGGLMAAEAAGVALERGGGRVWDMERQVRMAAGSLVVLGIVLGFLVHEAFCLLSAFVGAGLMFSAATDTCGMATVLGWMPWNKAARLDSCRR